MDNKDYTKLVVKSLKELKGVSKVTTSQECGFPNFKVTVHMSMDLEGNTYTPHVMEMMVKEIINFFKVKDFKGIRISVYHVVHVCSVYITRLTRVKGVIFLTIPFQNLGHIYEEYTLPAKFKHRLDDHELEMEIPPIK